MKEYVTSSGKKIHLYDDLFTYAERTSYYIFLQKSFYKIGGGDSIELYGKTFQIYSSYNYKDLNDLNMLLSPGFGVLEERYKLSERSVNQIRVNFSTYAEKNNIHQDNSKLTLLYYANLKWDISWGGHIFFLNESLDEIEFSIAYKPGRLLIFDGSIPHMIMTPTIQAESPRLSFVIQYGDIETP